MKSTLDCIKGQRKMMNDKDDDLKQFIPSSQQPELNPSPPNKEEHPQPAEAPKAPVHPEPEQPVPAATQKGPFGIHFSTTGAIAEVQEWLEKNCQADWSLELMEMDAELGKKDIEIKFDLEEDKLLFMMRWAA